MKLYDKNDYELQLEVVKIEDSWYSIDLNKETLIPYDKENLLKKKIVVIANLIK